MVLLFILLFLGVCVWGGSGHVSRAGVRACAKGGDSYE